LSNQESTIRALKDASGSPPGLCADAQRFGCLDSDDVFDFLLDSIRFGGRQVDLVEHWNHFEPQFDRRVAVGDALRLDALCRVNDQQCALAGGERPGNLVGKIHVPGGIDEIELVYFAVARSVIQGDALRLDRNTAFALQVHGIEDLVLHFAFGQAAAHLDKPVRKGRFTVINVRND
jgi:hypothetical protein